MKDKQILPACGPARAFRQSRINPPHRILVVEDDQCIRYLNTEVLSLCGYQVDGAEDGAIGWEALNAHTYDLMITDNSMPKMTGVELLAKLNAARMALPVIMATGSPPEEEFARQPWLRPAATLVKPYTVEQLLGTVKKVLREAEAAARLLEDRAIAENPTVQAPEPAAAPRRHPRQSILVVDEDQDLRQLYSEALAGPCYEVDVAADGAIGWAALQAKPYNLLITEHDMPKLTGVELVRKLRAAHMELPVVMAAGRMPTDELTRNPWLQFAATLVKPFAVGELLDTVRNVLRVTAAPPEQITPLANWQSQPSVAGLQL